MSVSGGRNDTIMNNRFVNNKAWGIIFVPYLDSGTPCTGGTRNSPFGAKLPVRRVRRRPAQQHVHEQRLLRPPDQRGLRAAQPRERPSDQLLPRQHADAVAARPHRPERRHCSRQYPSCNGQASAPSISNPTSSDEVLCDSQVELVSGFGRQPGGQVPAPHAGRDASAAEQPEDDAEPVLGVPRIRGARAASRHQGLKPSPAGWTRGASRARGSRLPERRRPEAPPARRRPGSAAPAAAPPARRARAARAVRAP